MAGALSVLIYFILQYTVDVSTAVTILHLSKLISEKFTLLPKAAQPGRGSDRVRMGLSDRDAQAFARAILCIPQRGV